ncbi:MAG: hypothetical protein K6U80_17135 [Firmicutes bacterium]|nr:hypothetical protein [Bacillota bacterium]
MAQPLAIYASIPASAGANWLSNSGNLPPVTVAKPYPFWPDLGWSDGNIAPTSGYGEHPQYLWTIPVADPNDFTPKTLTRRLTASSAIKIPNILQIPTKTGAGSPFRFIFSIAADDEYTFQLLVNEKTIAGESPATGFNFAIPAQAPWRNVKTYSFGTEANPVVLADGAVLDIQTTVTNLPQPPGENPAMVTWTLQIIAAAK